MKNILFIRESSGEKTGGIEGKILSIAENLARKELFRPALATSDVNSMFSNEFRNLGFPVYEIQMRNGLLRAARYLSDLIKDKKISVIQSHMFMESIVGRLAKNRNPDVQHIFRVHTHIEGSKIPRLRQYAYHLVDNVTSRWVDSFVTISEAVQNELVQKSRVLPEQVKVIYNGIPPLGAPDSPNMSSAPLTPSVVVIGDLSPRKQQELAVAAIGLLYQKGLDVKLHLIGADREGYMNKTKELSRKLRVEHLVKFHGFQKPGKIYDLIKAIPVVMLPSAFEGVPTSIIEGMSLRKIVITTPVGAATELVDHNVNGFLHPVGDAHSLSAILEEVFSSSAKSWEVLRSAGYQTWKKNFMLENMMDGLVQTYKSLGVFS